jgi:Leucine-rich repeat (LRR) protein
MANNRLQSLPESIGQLANLSVLHLYNNQLQSLPESIGLLRKLSILYLLDNPQLADVPRELLGRVKHVKWEGLGKEGMCGIGEDSVK